MTLDDGHRVGVTVGGQGVPLVFLHGIALSGRAYVRLLSRLAGMGFLVVALDAAGHGVTPNLPRNAADLSDRVDLTLRALDALGVRRAVFMGHSMGGRMVIQLAAVAPERMSSRNVRSAEARSDSASCAASKGQIRSRSQSSSSSPSAWFRKSV